MLLSNVVEAVVVEELVVEGLTIGATITSSSLFAG
jgi:hypothetical protein